METGTPQRDGICEATLNQFTGTARYVVHPLLRHIYLTDGAFHLYTHGAAWLVDDIVAYQLDHRVRSDRKLGDFQLWHLKVHDNRMATLSCLRDTNDGVFSVEIPWTDFPLDELKLFVMPQGALPGVKVILLPSEY